jgi:hypothetical protein
MPTTYTVQQPESVIGAWQGGHISREIMVVSSSVHHLFYDPGLWPGTQR